MPRTGRPRGRPPGALNKAKVELEALIAEAAQRATDGLTQEQIAAMSPLDVMLHAMKLEVAKAQWRHAAVFAEKAAPYIHPRLASEVHRVFNDDSQRSIDDIDAELAAIRSAAKDAAEAAKHDTDAGEAARASSGAREVEEGVQEQSNGLVH